MFWLIVLGTLALAIVCVALFFDYFNDSNQAQNMGCVVGSIAGMMGAIIFGMVFGGFWWVVAGYFIGALLGIPAGFAGYFSGKPLAVLTVILIPAGTILSVIFLGNSLPMPRWIVSVLGAVAGWLASLAIYFLPTKILEVKEARKHAALEACKERERTEQKVREEQERAERKDREEKERRQIEVEKRRPFEGLLSEIRQLANGSERERLETEVQAYLAKLSGQSRAQREKKLQDWKEQIERVKLESHCRECGKLFANDTDKFCECGTPRGVRK